MAIGRLFVFGMLILAVAFIGQTTLHLVPSAVAQEPGDSGQVQGTRIYYQYFPFVGRNYCENCCYFVDSVRGSDTNSGTSPAQAWRTLARVNAAQFEPGDTVHFRRGCSWSGGGAYPGALVIDDSGEEGDPITFTAYGDGPRPMITNPGDPDNWTRAVRIRADWVVVESLLVQDAHRDGMYIEYGANHNVVQDVEITDTGAGITIEGSQNLIQRNYIHDLHMVKSTPGGDDDFGAEAIKLYSNGSHNEIAYNRLERCAAPSYDYGEDGGGFSFFGDDIDGNYIHHNWVEDSVGFLELGGGSARNNVVAYNVSLNNGVFSWIHLTRVFASEVEGFRVEHNTIVETADNGWVVFGFNGDPTEDTFIMRNNIVCLEGFWTVSNESSFAHDHNLYYLSAGMPSFALGQGEKIADPLFANPDEKDFHLQGWSPAIDGGVALGYTGDFDDNPVPISAAPDLGAFEYSGAPERPPTPTPMPSPTPLPTPNPNEIIVDDADPGFSTSFSQGPWQQYAQVGGQHYGATHYYNRQAGTGEDIATWSFTVPQPGRYEVYAWWWDGSWRPADVPYTINYRGGSTTIRVNQQTRGGQWNLLGTFEFQGQGSVVMSDDVSSGRDIVADAVRLDYVAP